MGTTSYAQVMQNSAVSEKVDEAAAPVMKSRDQVLAQLREQHAVGVVVAVRGEIVWADLFADTDLLCPLLDQAGPLLCGREPHRRRIPLRAHRGRCAALSQRALRRH